MILRIWDVDETLARSYEAVETLRALHPEVEEWRWWHDEAWSSMLSELADPYPLAETLPEMDGEHWVLTGRNLRAVERWLQKYQWASKIVRVISVSNGDGDDGETAHDAKARVVAEVMAFYREVHVYDDGRRNCEAIRNLGGNVRVYRAVKGALVAL